MLSIKNGNSIVRQERESSMSQAYPEPTASLLSLGDPRKIDTPNDSYEWPDYIKKFGFSLKDVPFLIQILKDPAFKTADSTDPIVWSDLHAWRVLGQLQAVEAIPDLLLCLDYEDEGDVEDWAMGEMPDVLGKIGADGVRPLSDYINDSSKGLWSLAVAGDALEHIGKDHPEARDACVVALSKRLERYAENEDVLNGFLVSNLAYLKAVESLELIREAFHANVVDITVMGDLEDVEIKLGVRQERSTPRPEYHLCRSHCSHDEPLQVQRSPKIGRNDPCPCGSGKKYKKCCLE